MKKRKFKEKPWNKAQMQIIANEFGELLKTLDYGEEVYKKCPICGGPIILHKYTKLESLIYVYEYWIQCRGRCSNYIHFTWRSLYGQNTDFD